MFDHWTLAHFPIETIFFFSWDDGLPFPYFEVKLRLSTSTTHKTVQNGWRKCLSHGMSEWVWLSLCLFRLYSVHTVGCLNGDSAKNQPKMRAYSSVLYGMSPAIASSHILHGSSNMEPLVCASRFSDIIILAMSWRAYTHTHTARACSHRAKIKMVIYWRT